MSLGKREGSPGAAGDGAVPAAKRVKDEAPQFGADAVAPYPPAAASPAREAPAAPGAARQLTPPAAANNGADRVVPQSPLDVDYIICHLNVPDDAEVARVHSNTRTADKQVQAYAKLAGRNWTFYVQQLEIVIGRAAAESDEHVDIDLSPYKIVSRKHAVINYNLQKRQWEVTVKGRNGIRVDGQPVKKDMTVALRSGHVLEVGIAQMMFVLPDAEPLVASMFVERARESRQHAKRPSQELAAPDLRGDAPGAEPLGSSYPRGVAIVSRPQVAAGQGFEQDLGSDECKDIKPPFSYATMISQAILSTEDHMMSLADIYAWISRHYAFYRHSKPGWQNSIRHNLSLNKAFEKVARKEHEPGKGSKWHIVPEYKDDLIRKATTGKQFRNRAVSPRRSPVRDVQPVRSVPSRAPLDNGIHAPAPMMPPMPAGQPPFGHAGYGGMPLMPPAQGSPAMLPAQPRPSQREGSNEQAQAQAQAPQHQQPPPAGFPMAMPFQDANGNPFPLQSFQYMQPFGMPYMPPQQPGQPPMIPMMPPMQPHNAGQPEGRFGSGDRESEEYQPQPPYQSRRVEQPYKTEPDRELHTRSHSHSHSRSRSHSHSHSHSLSRSNSHGENTAEDTKPAYPAYTGHPQATTVAAAVAGQAAPPPELPAAAQLAGEDVKNEPAAKTDDGRPGPYFGSETPARLARPLGGDDTQTPLGGPGVRLAPPNGSAAPESSPALWKYMNLESTPNNNNVSTNGSSRTLAGEEPAKDAESKHREELGGVSPPGSSPPGLAQKGQRPAGPDMPVLQQWENRT